MTPASRPHRQNAPRASSRWLQPSPGDALGQEAMPTELEELVGFIAHPNPQIRLTAAENLVPYSTAEPAVFKAGELKPIKNLKILVRDHPKIAEHVLTILVNLSGDPEVLEELAKDEKFLELLYQRIVNREEPNANLIAMLLANLAKWDGLKGVLQTRQPAPAELGSDDAVLNQLIDLFVKGQGGSYNKHADFDYLAYAFADLAKHADVRSFFVDRQSYDGAIPLTKLKVFTEHPSAVRRKGVASAIKNVAFDVPAHPAFLSESAIDILPYVLLPLAGGEIAIDETMTMLPDLQLLPPDKKRDADCSIVQTHVETLTLLTTTRHGRDTMRRVNVYPVIRETHLRVDDDGVRDACERLVQVLMRDEADADGRVHEIEGDDDDKIVEI